MEAAQSADRTTKGKTFSSQLARLKEIVAQLEQEDLELEKGVRLYREACACVRFCRQKLSDARNVLESEEGGLRDAEEFLKDANLRKRMRKAKVFSMECLAAISPKYIFW